MSQVLILLWTTERPASKTIKMDNYFYDALNQISFQHLSILSVIPHKRT